MIAKARLSLARASYRRWLRVALAVALMAWLERGHARADGPTDVVWIAAGEAAPKLATQLRAELSVANFEPRPIAASEVVLRGDGLVTAVAARGAFALLRFSASPSAVEIWIVERETGRFVARESVPRARDDADARSVAMRTSELLRAELLSSRTERPPSEELSSASVAGSQALAAPLVVTEPPLQGQAPAPAPERAPAAAEGAGFVSTFAAGVGLALARTGPPFGPAFRVELDLLWRVRSRWTLAASAIMPTVTQVERESAGRLALRSGMLDAELRHELLDPHARLRPHAGIGAGLGWTHLRTRSAAPVVVERTRDFQACLLGLVGASLALASRATLAFDLRAGAALPRREPSIAGQKAGSSELPLVIGSLTLQLSFG